MGLKVKISERTIKQLGEVITGDGGKSKYRSGPMLVDYFNEFGLNHVYAQGFPSRWKFAQDCLRELNGTNELVDAIKAAIEPLEYQSDEHDLSEVINSLKPYFERDGYQIIQTARGQYTIAPLTEGLLDVNDRTEVEFGHKFIEEQISKCDIKIRDGDYSGSITNARSFLEKVLLEVEESITGVAPKNDGDLIKTYKRVQKVMNLDPSRKDLADSLRQVLSGITSIINGLAAMRNKLSDAHAAQYEAEKHHAVLAANAAKTIAVFVYESYQYQLMKGSINSPES